MRNKLWDELMQCKHNHHYCLFILERKKNISKIFTITVLAFSGAGGVMGWSVWKGLPLIACIIIAILQLLKLLESQLVPTDKEIEKLSKVISFYVDYFNKLEQLWYDYDNKRITEAKAQTRFYAIKNSEKEINDVVNEVVKKKIHKKSYDKAAIETTNYVSRTFNN